MSSLEDRCFARRHGASPGNGDAAWLSRAGSRFVRETSENVLNKEQVARMYRQLNDITTPAIIAAVERDPIYRDDIPHR